MTYDIAKAAFVKEKFWIIELDLDYCDNTYGLAPCTAAIGVTGDVKCFNTAKSCQDRANYIQSPKTYRFCTKRSPLPSGLDAIPSLAGAPSISGAQINPSGGLGVRGSISVNFIDHPSADIDIDKYFNERTYDPYTTGTYWGKFRARNPYYNNRAMRAYSGYLVDGVYDPANFQQRTYVIENISPNRGFATVTGKDVLKLADNDRAQYPPKSTGELSASISNSATLFTLSPAGVGDLEYGASGFVRIAEEVMSFTRTGDVMTVVRGQYTTEPTEHDISDSVQQCAYINDTVDNIDYLLLTEGAGVDPVLIDQVEWSIEVTTNIPYMLEALITEPVGVQKLLKELGDNAPHFLYFDEKTQLIKLVSVKQPPISTNVLNNQLNILDGLKVADDPKSRLSDVIIYFGQRDPTKKMDEVNNYAQTYIRTDLASSGDDEYGSKKIETLYSRWINNFNKAAAVDVATRKGRRFGITPRQVSFSMTSKDSDYGIGDNITIDHPVLQNFDGSTGGNIFQITSVKEAGDFEYTALEYVYSEELPDDTDPGVNLVIIGGDVNNINLRAIYDSIFPTPTIDTVVKFIIDSNVDVGSSSTDLYSINTGIWPELTGPLLLEVRGYALGKGGSSTTTNGEYGGPAIILNHDVTIQDVTGLIGGGGGAGGTSVAPTKNKIAYGGGGAGIPAGNGASKTNGGNGQYTSFFDFELQELQGGDGGDPGQTGENASSFTTVPTNDYLGGAAGNAINKNGYTLIVENGGANILGVII